MKVRFMSSLPLTAQKFKNSWFQLARNDRNILTISNDYVEELRGLPNTKLNAIQALISVRFP